MKERFGEFNLDNYLERLEGLVTDQCEALVAVVDDHFGPEGHIRCENCDLRARIEFGATTPERGVTAMAAFFRGGGCVRWAKKDLGDLSDQLLPPELQEYMHGERDIPGRHTRSSGEIPL